MVGETGMLSVFSRSILLGGQISVCRRLPSVMDFLREGWLPGWAEMHWRGSVALGGFAGEGNTARPAARRGTPGSVRLGTAAVGVGDVRVECHRFSGIRQCGWLRRIALWVNPSGSVERAIFEE